LEEYGRKNWLTSLIEINIANLAGVPSIIYGLMALGLFVYGLHLGQSVLSAGLTLACLILPIVIVATREALRTIPAHMREAAYALGATKWQVIWHHLLPYSSGGIATGLIIGVSRAIGETAPLITIGALTFIAFLPPAPLHTASPFVFLRVAAITLHGAPDPDVQLGVAADQRFSCQCRCDRACAGGHYAVAQCSGNRHPLSDAQTNQMVNWYP